MTQGLKRALCASLLLLALSASAQDAAIRLVPVGVYDEPDPAAKYVSVPPARRAEFSARINAALQEHPNDPLWLVRRAYLFQEGGDAAQAERDFSKALLHAEPGSITQRSVLWSMGWARYDQGEYDDARAAWEHAIKAHGGKPYWQAYTFALLSWTEGDKQAALAWFDAAVKANAMWGTDEGFAGKTKFWRPAQQERMRALFAAWKHAGASAPNRDVVPPPDDRLVFDRIDGKSLGEWTARWWHWALSQPVQPFLDPDGRFCASGQEGAVWFLAGTDGSFRPKRECEVPQGKYLLVPVINMVYWQRSTVGPRSRCEDLQAAAAVNNDHLRSAVVLLDDKPIGDVRSLRIRSEGCFPMDPDDPASPLGAADGYWLMIEPLSSGRHTLVVGANYRASDVPYAGMNQNFEYVLHVGGMTTLSSIDAGSLLRR